MNEHFGTSPVSDAYFKLSREDEDKAVRDMILSCACKVEEETPFEDFEGIAVDMSGPVPVFSKGWREFFKCELEDE